VGTTTAKEPVSQGSLGPRKGASRGEAWAARGVIHSTRANQGKARTAQFSGAREKGEVRSLGWAEEEKEEIGNRRARRQGRSAT